MFSWRIKNSWQFGVKCLFEMLSRVSDYDFWNVDGVLLNEKNNR